MIVERVELEIRNGQVEAFLRFAESSRELLQSLKGCLSFTFGQGIESPSKVLFLVGWASMESHKAVSNGSELAEFRKELAGFLAGRPSVEHFHIGVPAST